MLNNDWKNLSNRKKIKHDPIAIKYKEIVENVMEDHWAPPPPPMVNKN